MQPLQEEPMSRSESLRIIEGMIMSARHQMTENGHLYRLWGWVILICSLGQYTMQYLIKSPNHNAIWMLTWVAVIYQFFYIRHKKRKAVVKTYADDVLKYVWLVFIALMILMGLLLYKLTGDEQLVPMATLVVYGMPTTLSGVILKFRPLVLGGIGCWVLAVTAMYVPHEYYMLFVAVAVVIAWIVPGYLLREKAKIQNAS